MAPRTYHRTRRWLLAAAALSCGTPALSTGIADATALTAALRAGQPAVTLLPEQADRGCGLAGCSIDVGGLSLRAKPGQIRRTGGKALRLDNGPQGTPALPALDWDPLAAYTVGHNGQRWGSCLEFTHSGAGKSGSLQRWTSVVLVPWSGRQPGSVAYRFVGYWASCEALVASAPGMAPAATPAAPASPEVALPLVVPDRSAAAGALKLVWQRCSLAGCQAQPAPRSVRHDPKGEGGALLID